MASEQDLSLEELKMDREHWAIILRICLNQLESLDNRIKVHLQQSQAATIKGHSKE